MPKIDEKGLNVTEWLFKLLWGLSVYFLIDLHNQTKSDRQGQQTINAEIVKTLNSMQVNEAKKSTEYEYLRKEVQEVKADVKDLKKELQLR